MISWTNAFAQKDSLIHDGKIPSINDHVFPTSTYLRSSFIVTNLQAEMGFGTTSKLKLPGITIGDYELFAFEGKILFVDLGIQYQQRFTSWLAFYASFKMAGRLGSDFSTIVADGVNTISGAELGWLFRIKQTKKLNLSGTVSLYNLKGNFINVSQFIEEVLANNPYPSVVKHVPSMMVGLGLRGAYGFSPTFGLQMQFDYAYGESFERGSTQGFFSAGILGDVDFNPKWDIPIGLGVGYSISTAPEIVMNDGGFTNMFLLNLGYTGAKDFKLGAQYTYYNVELKSIEDKPFINKILLTLQFYF